MIRVNVTCSLRTRTGRSRPVRSRTGGVGPGPDRGRYRDRYRDRYRGRYRDRVRTGAGPGWFGPPGRAGTVCTTTLLVGGGKKP